MHGWIRNPKAPSSLWDGLVLDGAYAGLHPGTNRFVDGSGLENHGTLTNYADAQAGWRFDDATGWGTNHTSGGTDHVLVAGKLPTASSARTLSLWLLQRTRDTATSFAGLLDQVKIGAAQSFTLQMTGTSPAFLFTDAVNSANNISLSGPEIPELNQWSHISFAFDGSLAWKYSLNGQVAKSGNFGVGINTVSTSLAIGRRVSSALPNANLNGVIAAALVHSRALTPDEITWLADRGNRLYVEDTRRAIWVPTPFNPALMRRRRRMAGAR